MSSRTFVIPFDAIPSFCKAHGIASLALFGSVARGEARDDSDIDLLVEFKPDAPIGFLSLLSMQRELSGLFHRRVDLVPKAGLKPAIRGSILDEMKVLYAE